MSDLDLSEFDEAIAPSSRGCWHTKIGERLTPEQVAKIEAALVSPRYPNTAIARVMRSWGYSIGDNVIGKHRLGRCSCND